jgi:LuxR family transcriptional regulator, regulator of acetate metabolism
MEAATVPSERAVAALAQLRALLGPDALASDGEAAMDAASLEQLVDDGLADLRQMLPGYSGPEAASVAALALELAEIRLELAGERTTRRLDGVLQVQRALARLRAVGSTDQMLDRAPEAVCHYLGFEAAVLWRVEEGLVTPAAAYSKRDRDWGDKVQHFASKWPPIQLDAMVLETEMLRRRGPGIIHDITTADPVVREIAALSDVTSYVAAPVMPEGRVIGFLHATTMKSDDILDRDVLWAFAEGYGYALERTILLQRLHDQGERIRELVVATESVLTDIREAGLQISSTSEDLQAAEAEPVRSAMFSAPDSRIHQLLTRRELEIIELLAHGETNKQIAERIVVSEGTVKSHVSQILRKMHAVNRAEAVSKFVRLTGKQ